MICIPVFIIFALVPHSGASSQRSMQDLQHQVFKWLKSMGSDGNLLTFPWCYRDEGDEKNGAAERYTNLKKQHLVDENFTDSRYFDLLQAKNQSALNVFVDIGIYQIVEISEKHRYLALKMQTLMCWEDCRVAWQYSQFPLSQLILSSRLFNDLKMFVPRVTVLEELDPTISLQADRDALVIPGGFVCIRKTYPTTLMCNVDVKMYPFDTQKCTVTFGATQQRMVVSLSPLEDLLKETGTASIAGAVHTMSGRFTHSDTWELVIRDGERSVHGACVQDGSQSCELSDSVVHHLVLRRRPTYQLINLMLPAFVIVLISSCIFILPPHTEDKMGLSVTVLLSMFIFMQIMYNKMPETGETLPLLSQYYLVCVALVALSCITSSISVILDASNKPAPVWLSRLVRKCAGRWIRSSSDGLHKRPLLRVATNNEQQCSGSHKNSSASQVEVTAFWQLVIVFDRLFFVIHLSTSISVLIVYLVYGYIPWKCYNYHLSASNSTYVKEVRNV